MQSLFVKCQKCQQRPATIKCTQCKYGQVYRLCYACDSQVHVRTGQIDQQHKTEIIPYQEMYQKNQTFVPPPQKPEKNQFKKDIKTKEYPEATKQSYSKTIDVNKQLEYVEKKHDARYDQTNEKKSAYSSNQKPQDGQTERLKVELNMAKDKEKELQRRMSKLEQDYELKNREDKQKIQQLTEQNKNLEQKLNQVNKQNKELQKQVEEQQQQFEQLQQEFNIEEIQQAFEEKEQESNMKDQIIQQFESQLQDIQEAYHKLQDEVLSNSRTKKLQQSSNKKSQKSQSDKDDIIQELSHQLEEKDKELNELKELFDQMNNEKQQILEEAEKLENENNQFREIFSQNLHLFGIDPEQLNEEGHEEEDEQDGDHHEQIDEENDDQGD